MHIDCVCVCTCVKAHMWKSVDKLRCQSSPPIVFEVGSPLPVHCECHYMMSYGESIAGRSLCLQISGEIKNVKSRLYNGKCVLKKKKTLLPSRKAEK